MILGLKAFYVSALPSRFSGAVALLVAAGIWAMGSVMLAFTFADDQTIDVLGFFMLMGLMVLPAGGVVLFIGSLVNWRWTARAIQLAATTCLFVLSWLFLTIGYSEGDMGLQGGFLVSTVFFFLPIGIAGVLALICAVLGFFEVRREIDALREAWLTQTLDLRGWIALDEIRSHTGWDLARAEVCADKAGFEATIEGQRLRLDRVAQRHRERILAMVQTRGKLGLDELQSDLQEPEDALIHRVAELQESGDFHGYLDGKTLFSSDMAKLASLGRCPACAGELNLAGKGLIRCNHCDAVVYL